MFEYTFRELYRDGKVEFEEIHDWVDYWHEDNSLFCDLSEYLGLTKDEYELWLQGDDVLKFTLDAERK